MDPDPSAVAVIVLSYAADSVAVVFVVCVHGQSVMLLAMCPLTSTAVGCSSSPSPSSPYDRCGVHLRRRRDGGALRFALTVSLAAPVPARS
jgi:hypothetical protein